jgi:hypothetical protein
MAVTAESVVRLGQAVLAVAMRAKPGEAARGAMADKAVC